MSDTVTGRSIEILLAEDNLGDERLTREAFRESKLSINLHVVNDGVEVLAFLQREDKYRDSVRPDLILLDLNLPKKDGREVLSEIKSDNELKHIPVVVLTVSKSEDDIFNAYNLHANCYITKPFDLEQFIKVIKSIEEFWFSTVSLPDR